MNEQVLLSNYDIDNIKKGERLVDLGFGWHEGDKGLVYFVASSSEGFGCSSSSEMVDAGWERKTGTFISVLV